MSAARTDTTDRSSSTGDDTLPNRARRLIRRLVPDFHPLAAARPCRSAERAPNQGVMTAVTMSETWSVERVPARMPSKNVG